MALFELFRFPREVSVVIKLDPEFLALLQSLLIDQGDRERATQLAADVRARTAALSAALSTAPLPPT